MLKHPPAQPARNRTTAALSGGARVQLSARQAGVAGPTEGLGHTLRTPLTALNGALGLLGAGLGGELPADARALLDIALRNCAVLQNAVEAHLAKQRANAESASPAGSIAIDKVR